MVITELSRSDEMTVIIRKERGKCNGAGRAIVMVRIETGA
jgi:hypothetical protein